MTTARRSFLVFFCLLILGAAIWACVGDDPTNPSITAPDSGTPDTSSGGVDSSSGGIDSGDPDANGTPCSGGITCDGTCVIDKTDKKNCGRCAHDCGNGQCTAGVCKQALIGGDANGDAGSVITSLSTDQTHDNPAGLAQRVFWSVVGTGAGVFQDTVLGGNSVTLSSGTSTVGQTNVVVDQTTVYWFSQNFAAAPQPLLKAAVNGSGSQLGYGTNNGPFIQAITYDAARKNVVGSYKVTSSTLGTFKCGPSDGTVTCAPLGATFTGTPGGNVAIDNANLYYCDIDLGVIYREALTGGNSSAYKTGEATPSLVRVDGNNVFWANAADKKIQRGSLGSPGTIVPLATAANSATGLAADPINVYWTDAVLGTVNYAPRNGAGPNTAYVTLGASSTPMRLVRDTGFLYFTHNGGIYRVALP